MSLRIPKLSIVQSLRTKLLLYFVVIVIVPVVAASAFSLEVVRTIIENETFTRLNVIVEQKALQIETPFDYPDLVDEVRFVREQSEEDIISEIVELRGQTIPDELLQEMLPLVSPDDDFAEVFLIDVETGLVFASSNPSQIGREGSPNAFETANRAAAIPLEDDEDLDTDDEQPPGEAGDPDELDDIMFLFNFHANENYRTAAYTLAVPILDENDETIAIYGAHVYQPLINDAVGNTSGLGQTGEAILVNAENERASYHRFFDVASDSFSEIIARDEQRLRENGLQSSYINYRGKEVYGVMRDLDHEGLRLFVEIEKTEALAPLAVFARVIIVTAAIIMLGLIALAVLSAQKFLRPIKQLSDGVKKFGRGDLSSRISARSEDEIGQLAHAFNTMAQQIEDDIDKLKETERLKSEFIKITSHNLRTPITILNGYIDTLTRATTLEDIEVMSTPLKHNSERLRNLVEDIVTISELEHSEALTYSGTMAFELITVANELHQEFTDRAVVAQLAFNADIPTQEAYVRGNRAYIRIALWNILDNAIKYTIPPEGSRVNLVVSIQGNSATVTISDNGIGIPKEEQANLFTKFHKASGVLVSNFDGAGVGLYITKRIIKQHGGTITVVSSQTGTAKGTVFTVTLPIQSKPNQEHQSVRPNH